MFAGFRLRVLSVMVLALPLTLGTVSPVQGNPEPPGGGERVIKPPIDAVFTGAFSGSEATFTVAGACRKIAVAFGPFILPMTASEFANMTADNIEDLRFRGVGPAGCFSAAGGEDVVVSRVTNFNNTGTVLGAEISIVGVQPR